MRIKLILFIILTFSYIETVYSQGFDSKIGDVSLKKYTTIESLYIVINSDTINICKDILEEVSIDCGGIGINYDIYSNNCGSIVTTTIKHEHSINKNGLFSSFVYKDTVGANFLSMLYKYLKSKKISYNSIFVDHKYFIGYYRCSGLDDIGSRFLIFDSTLHCNIKKQVLKTFKTDTINKLLYELDSIKYIQDRIYRESSLICDRKSAYLKDDMSSSCIRYRQLEECRYFYNKKQISLENKISEIVSKNILDNISLLNTQFKDGRRSVNFIYDIQKKLLTLKLAGIFLTVYEDNSLLLYDENTKGIYKAKSTKDAKTYNLVKLNNIEKLKYLDLSNSIQDLCETSIKHQSFSCVLILNLRNLDTFSCFSF